MDDHQKLRSTATTIFCFGIIIFSIIFSFVVFVDASVSSSPSGTLECSFCELASNFLIINPSGVYDIEFLLNKFCSILPKGDQPVCIQGVSGLDLILQNLTYFLDRSEKFDAYALCTMVNACDIDCCISDAPEQVHISYLDDPHTSVGVTWVTRQETQSLLYFGTDSKNLNQMVNGTCKTYSPGYWKGWIHNVELTNLAAGTTYYYKVGDPSVGFTSVFKFRTEPENGNSFKFISIGDMGIDNAQDNKDRLTEIVVNGTEVVDFLIHNGDISYADGFQQRWDTFFRSIQVIAANLPYMVTPGNHEIGIISALKLTVGYIYRFLLPGGTQSLSPDYSNLFYSWNYHNVHFVALDTESELDIALLTDKQIQWLEEDLASVDRQSYPWVIVYAHRPFYCSNLDDDCSVETVVLRGAAEDLFYRYKVNLVLTAHKHAYERLWPVYQGVPKYDYNDPGLPVYIVNGAGGNREGLEKDMPTKMPVYSAKFVPSFGYAIVTVYNDTDLDHDFYDAATGGLLDHVRITRGSSS